MRASLIITYKTLLKIISCTAQVTTTSGDETQEIAKRPLDCGGILFNGPVNRCPEYGTVTLSTATVTTERTVTYTATTNQTIIYTTTSVNTITTTQLITITQTLPARTQTATATTTQQAAQQPPANCANQGWQYAVFKNTPVATWQNGRSTQWSSSNMKRGGTYPVLFTGVTSSAGGFSCSQGQNITLYGRGIEFPCEQFSIMHRAYIVAPYAGGYYFEASNVDDDFAYWDQDEAYTGFNDSNALFRAPYQDGSGPGAGKTVWYLQPGDYMPIRIAYGNAYGGASFNFRIELGNGSTLVESLVASPYIVQYGCNPNDAAPFPYDFGDEV